MRIDFHSVGNAFMDRCMFGDVASVTHVGGERDVFPDSMGKFGTS